MFSYSKVVLALTVLAGGILLEATTPAQSRMKKPNGFAESYCQCTCVLKMGQGRVALEDKKVKPPGDDITRCTAIVGSECKGTGQYQGREGKIEACTSVVERQPVPPVRQLAPQAAPDTLAPAEPTPSPGTRQMIPPRGGVLAPR